MTKYAKSSARPAQKLADGGSVGTWERIKAGNIDDPASEAYRRWGAGSKADAPAAAPAPAPAPAPADTGSDQSDAETSRLSRQDSTGDQTDAETSRLSRQDSQSSSVSAPRGPSKVARKTTTKPGSNYSNEGRRSSTSDYGNEGRRTAAAPAPQKRGIYSNAIDEQNQMVDKVKSLFTRSSNDNNDSNYVANRGGKPADANYVNGGLIGNASLASPAGGANSVVKSQLFNPAHTENALGGGRKSYGKK